MSNLGWYQRMTTLSKRVGGPEKLVAIVAAGGFVVIRTGEAGVKWALRTTKGRLAPGEADGPILAVTAASDGTRPMMRVGDRYRVLASDGDSVLIEVIGDADNPYFVSAEFLRSISGYPPTEPS